MLVEAARAAARAPGPLRAFFLRVRARRGQHVAAVATARKLAVIIWHLLSKGESYADGMTMERYEHDLERNIRDLCDRVHPGRYRPQPVRRTYIPKADGGRPRCFGRWRTRSSRASGSGREMPIDIGARTWSSVHVSREFGVPSRIESLIESKIML